MAAFNPNRAMIIAAGTAPNAMATTGSMVSAPMPAVSNPYASPMRVANGGAARTGTRKVQPTSHRMANMVIGYEWERCVML